MFRNTRRSRLTAALLAIAAAATAAPAFAVSDILIEAKCASGPAYVEGGTGWGNSASKSNKSPCSTGSRSSKNANAWADFIPAVTVPSTYDVYLTWGTTTSSNNGPNAENVDITLTDLDGSRVVTVNMRGHSACTPNSDQMVFVGRVNLLPGSGHKVRIANTGSGQCYNGPNKRYVTADAVFFQAVQPVPTAPASWSGLKARLLD